MANKKRVVKPYSSKNKILGMWGEIKECLDQEIARKEVWKVCQKKGYFECTYSFFLHVIQLQRKKRVGGVSVTHQKRLIEYLPDEAYSKKAKILRVWDGIETLLNKGLKLTEAHKACQKKGYFDVDYLHFIRVVRQKKLKDKKELANRRFHKNTSLSKALQQSDEITAWLDQKMKITKIYGMCKERGYIDCGYPHFVQIIRTIRRQRKKAVSGVTPTHQKRVIGYLSKKYDPSTSTILKKWDEINECLEKGVKRKEIWKACQKRGYFENSYSLFRQVIQRQREKAVALGGVRGGEGIAHADQKRLIEDFSDNECYSKKVNILRVWDEINECLEKGVRHKEIWEVCQKRGYFECSHSFFMKVVTQRQKDKAVALGGAGVTHQKRLIEYFPNERYEPYSKKAKVLRVWDKVEPLLNKDMSVKAVHKECKKKGYIDSNYSHFVWVVREKRSKLQPQTRKGPTNKRRLRINSSMSRALQQSDEIGEYLDQEKSIKEIHRICTEKGYIRCGYLYFLKIIQAIREERKKVASLRGVRVGEGIAHADQKRGIGYLPHKHDSSTSHILKKWDEINECWEKGVKRKEIYKACQKRGYFKCSYRLFLEVIQKQRKKAASLAGVGVTHQKRLIEDFSNEYYSKKANILRVWGEIEALLNKGMNLKAVHKACIEAGYFDAAYYYFVRVVRQKRDKLQPQTRKGPTNKRRLHINSSTSRALHKSDEIGEYLDQGMKIIKIYGICKEKGYIDCGYPRFVKIIQIIRQEREKAPSLTGVGVTHQKRLIEDFSNECHSKKANILRVLDEIVALLNKGMNLKAAHKACIEAGYFDADYVHFVRVVRQKIDELQPQTRKGPTNKRRLRTNSSKSRALHKSDEIGEYLDQGKTIKEIHSICTEKGYVFCGYTYFLNIIQAIRQEREKAASLGAVRVGDGIAHADQKGKQLPVSDKIRVSKEGSGILKSAPKHQSEQFA